MPSELLFGNKMKDKIHKPGGTVQIINNVIQI